MSTKIPRSVRNNNPGNIRFNGSQTWRGQTGQDEDRFLTFDYPIYGCRALIKLLHSYRVHDGLVTLSQMVTRFAPPIENSTRVYMLAVCRLLLRPPHWEPVTLDDFAIFARAIAHMETGYDPYPDYLWHDATILLKQEKDDED